LDWAEAQAEVATSALTLVEFRCLLARRRRAEQIDGDLEASAMARFDQDIQDRTWRILPDGTRLFEEARLLIDQLPGIPLRALDALHLPSPSQRRRGLRHRRPEPGGSRPAPGHDRFYLQLTVAAMTDTHQPLPQTKTRSSPSAARSSPASAPWGIAFPNDFERTDYAADLHSGHSEVTKEDLEAARSPCNWPAA
jgi:hypothetical protein